ncbi:prion-like-(Q/N-rich) domain-bearing protein 25 [Microplitis mediator]|uniref:prion-like-(Q/N-rich) domain-bearing protein 25 n=1 Tax=Microplitis mediator TaxID=375433 RepID=UPI0025567B0F|nr:prion-like-(Q/N-rich) domain-bearing protein 25 [Microplitis mediator]
MLIPSKLCVPIKLGQKCNYDEDCRKIYYAKCSENKECVCKSNYVKVNQTCAPLLGEYCWNSEQCITVNSDCINHKCQCKYNYRERFDKCVPEFLEVFCEIDPHCEIIPNAKCAKNKKKCVCKRGYVQYNKLVCVPLLDEFCLSDQHCHFNNSICVNNKCSCQPNYVQELNDKCLPCKYTSRIL